jgi:hypothetical protein
MALELWMTTFHSLQKSLSTHVQLKIVTIFLDSSLIAVVKLNEARKLSRKIR